MQNLDVKSPGSAGNGTFADQVDLSAATTKVKLNIARVGVSYHF